MGPVADAEGAAMNSDAHDLAAAACARAAMEMSAERKQGTCAVIYLGAAAEARLRGVPVDELILGRAELVSARDEITRLHGRDGTASCADLEQWLEDARVRAAVQERAQSIMILRAIEEDRFAYPQGGAA